MKTSSISVKNYIKAVYDLTTDHEGVRISDIANRVGVTKPSTCCAMKRLQEKGLVYRDNQRLVYLTQEGEHKVVLEMDRIAVISRLFIETLGVDYEAANADAHAISHVVSVETLCAICRFNKKIDAKYGCLNTCYLQEFPM